MKKFFILAALVSSVFFLYNCNPSRKATTQNSTPIEKPTPVTTFVKKIFNNSFFKILPNPTANGRLGLSVKQAGMYTVQIFDNNSKLVHVAEITINDKGQVVHITLPNCVSKGNYYVRLIDTKTKKEYPL